MHCSYITCTVITWNSKNLLCSLHKNFCGYYQKQHFTIFASHAGAVAKYCDEYVCLWACLSVCLSTRISWEPHAQSLPNFLCMLPMSMARSSSDIFTIVRIVCHREGVFFPDENALSAGKGGWECTARAKYPIYDCLVLFVLSTDLCFTNLTC